MMLTTPPPERPDKPQKPEIVLPPLPPDEKAAKAEAEAAKFREKVSALNDALEVDWDGLESKLNGKVKVFLENLGHLLQGGSADTTAEILVDGKPAYFTFSVRRKAPPEPKKFPRFVMWGDGEPGFAYTEQERSAFLDAHPGYQYAQIPQE